MINKWTRTMALVLTAVMLLSVSVNAEANGGSGIDELKDKLLSDCYEYTYAQETLYGHVLWAISYVEQYDQARSWDRLQIARAAVNEAWDAISRLELPKQSMNDDDYNELLLSDVDATFLELEDFVTDRTPMLKDLQSIRRRLAVDVFESRSWETSVRYVELIREITEGYLQYWANAVDWLLQEIDDTARAEQFSALLSEHCPYITSRRTKGALGQEELETETGQLLTEIQGLMDSLSELIGQMDADKTLYEDAINSGNVADGIGEIIRIDGLPMLLPYPEWGEELSAQRITYYWKDGDDVLRIVTAGEAIDTCPNVCEIETSGVSRKDLENYRECLDSMGIDCMDTNDSNGILRLCYVFGSGQLTFECGGDILTTGMLENPVCFAPEWYIDASTAG